MIAVIIRKLTKFILYVFRQFQEKRSVRIVNSLQQAVDHISIKALFK